jgi:acyl-CoA synthetase (AMP-forming)/AMP-acid ligase II/acyl carrier protein
MHQAILARLANDVPPATSLRFIRSSSASLPPSVLGALEDGFGVPVIEAYGMTEAAHQMTSNHLPPGVRKPGSVGTAAGPEVRVMTDSNLTAGAGHVGEVVIRGENVTSGYVGIDDRGSHFLDGEWFRTGDQGYLDPDGFLFLTGRLKEIINRGGETIAPREIDEVMLDIEGIAQAVAFSVPDEILGEEVAAVVVPHDGAVLTEADIQARVAERLSFAKIPKRVIFADAIPKGPTGKLQRVGLAEKLGVASVRTTQAASTDALSATGERLTTLWRQVLEVAHVDPDEPFLEAGGDSIAATALAVAVEEEFDMDLPLLAFYDAATIRSQADLIDALAATSNDA